MLKVVQTVQPEPPTIIQIVKKRRTEKRILPKKISRRIKTTLTRKDCLKILGIIAAVFFGAAAIVGLVMTCLLVFQNQLFYPAASVTTTTKVSGSVTLNIGQLCQWNNQCPNNAFCLGTCQCSDTHYFSQTLSTCEPAGTFNSICSQDYECNRVSGLVCIGNRCVCEATGYFWDGGYTGGGGAILGRCAARKAQGVTNNAGTCLANFNTGANLGSTSTICTCDFQALLNFKTGNCETPAPIAWQPCTNSLECPLEFSACMNIDGDSYTKCTPLPTHYFLGNNFFLKGDYGDPCNLYAPCNEFLNLKCTHYYGNITGTCECYSKYQYYNGTMCVYGKRYGENCTLTSECVPQSTTGSMTCMATAGTFYTVCRCTTTQYYDQFREQCRNLRRYNQLCLDNAECFDAYRAIGYCGFTAGGSESVCRCIYNYYSTNNNLCVAARTVGSTCNGLIQPQCEYNSYCDTTLTPAICVCGDEKFQNTNGSCLYLGYRDDPCDSTQAVTQCWGGACPATNLCP